PASVPTNRRSRGTTTGSTASPPGAPGACVDPPAGPSYRSAPPGDRALLVPGTREMADNPTPGPATVLAPDPDLLPALRPLASRPAARDALLWRPHDPLLPTGVLLPADIRAEAASVLEPRG